MRKSKEKSANSKAPKRKPELGKKTIRDLGAKGAASKIKGGAYTVGRLCIEGDGS